MFISKTEKSHLYKLIAELQIKVRELEKILSNEAIDLSKALSHEAYRREYSKRYYWKKKAEKLAAAKPTKKGAVDLSSPTTVTITPHDSKGSK